MKEHPLSGLNPPPPSPNPPGETAQVQLEPKQADVLRGNEAKFNCSVTGTEWIVMTWLLNGNTVLTILKSNGPQVNDRRFGAVNRTTDQSDMWEFIIKDTQRNNSGEITCDVQNINKKSATLSVQDSGTVAITSGNVTSIQKQRVMFHCLAIGWYPEPLVEWTFNGVAVDRSDFNVTTVGSGGLFNSNSTLSILGNYSGPVQCQASPVEEDQTVLIAVLVSVLGAALLVLLIIGIALCCKRRRAAKSSYEEEVRKTRSQSERTTTTEPAQGRENMGYMPDSKTGVASSDFNDSGFSQTNSFRTVEMPDVVEYISHTANGNGAKMTKSCPEWGVIQSWDLWTRVMRVHTPAEALQSSKHLLQLPK
ncbi:hypothetical protein JZ751_019236 [Albula glossodonta]|uniref:Ig-like domain-containing protein n=1 Tax=Albula glossodonta TaxID=121402 RepID=A0A8T2NYF4_9TELE|nr:hypothetical protein JZ751_019236 [Albula glossodonta]